MNVLICGLPGNGKGVKAMSLLVEELRLGKRPIITNLAVEKLPWVTGKHESRRGLQDWLFDKYNDDFNCNERIFRISDEAVQNFYLFRALSRKQVEKIGAAHLIGYREVLLTDGYLKPLENFLHTDYRLYMCDHVMKGDKSGRKHCEKFDSRLLELSGPHMNIADECWKFWPARGWQSTSEADVYYNAQHRHYGDDNLYLTQRDNDIDAIIVGRCQESIVMTHHGKMSFGMFRQPDLFSEAVYNGRPMPSKDPMTRRVFRLDVKGLCQGYDTSAGVGITGRGQADMGGRKKGLPFWLLPVLGVFTILLIGLLLVKGGKFATHIFNHKKPLEVASHAATAPGAVVTNSPALSENQTNFTLLKTNVPFCVGYSVLLGDARAYFSDGRVYTTANGLQTVELGAVVIDGVRYKVYPNTAPQVLPAEYPVEIRSIPVSSSASRPVNQAQVTVIGSRSHNSYASKSVSSQPDWHMIPVYQSPDVPDMGHNLP